MKPSVFAILALGTPILAGCAGFGFSGDAGRATPAVAASAPAAQPMAPVGAVQAQPLPPTAPAPTASFQPAPPAQSVAPAVPLSASLGGIFGGPIGAALTQEDRQAAWKAQIAALDSGQRRPWRGTHGVFGFVEPGAETGKGCRDYTQTVYVGGRPNRGQGVACKQADGAWKVTS